MFVFSFCFVFFFTILAIVDLIFQTIKSDSTVYGFCFSLTIYLKLLVTKSQMIYDLKKAWVRCTTVYWVLYFYFQESTEQPKGKLILLYTIQDNNTYAICFIKLITKPNSSLIFKIFKGNSFWWIVILCNIFSASTSSQGKVNLVGEKFRKIVNNCRFIRCLT